MALIESDSPSPDTGRLPSRAVLDHARRRLQAWLGGDPAGSATQRMAGGAFVIRVASAGLAYLTQVLLARWMGAFEFGIFVYVWTWVMLIGVFVDVGLSTSAQRFIPEYRENGATAKLRGFVAASRWLAFWIASALALLGAVCIHLLSGYLDEYTIVPLYIACVCLPVYGVLHVQDGIARCYDWVNLALLPPYILRQAIVIVLMGAAWLAGAPTDAVSAVTVSAIAIWITAFGQMLLLNRKLKRKIEHGTREYDVRKWFAVSLPMFAVDGLYSLLTYVDVLVLKQFRSPEEIAIYYAALKTLSLIAFVYFAIAAAAGHRFAEFHVGGDRERLHAFLRNVVRWTFWPSVALAVLVLACGWPLLRIFGATFVDGYHLMFIFAVGLLARASIGPAERLLVLVGEQRLCAMAAGAAFLVNLALCLLLVPNYGINGAAVSIAAAFVMESALLFAIARRKLGINLFVFSLAERV